MFKHTPLSVSNTAFSQYLMINYIKLKNYDLLKCSRLIYMAVGNNFGFGVLIV